MLFSVPFSVLMMLLLLLLLLAFSPTYVLLRAVVAMEMEMAEMEMAEVPRSQVPRSQLSDKYVEEFRWSSKNDCTHKNHRTLCSAYVRSIL